MGAQVSLGLNGYVSIHFKVISLSVSSAQSHTCFQWVLAKNKYIFIEIIPKQPCRTL